MPDVVREFLSFLRNHKMTWILPIVVFALIAGLVAWKLANTADNPFAYDLR
jgi:Family of unknown function (DUF5989)